MNRILLSTGDGETPLWAASRQPSDQEN